MHTQYLDQNLVIEYLHDVSTLSTVSLSRTRAQWRSLGKNAELFPSKLFKSSVSTNTVLSLQWDLWRVTSPSQLVMFNKILTPKFDIKSATLPNRKYGARVAQKKAMYESLTLESLSSMSTSSIEYSRRQEPAISRNPSSDFSDKVTPFCYTRNGYKTLADKDCQTENADPEIDKVNTFWTDTDDC